MGRKLELQIESLAVESFETGAGHPVRGTVRGNDAGPRPTPPVQVDDCTCNASCLCPTNAYYCATVMQTAVSCNYTYNDSCQYDTYNGCETYAGCPSYPLCVDTETC